MLQEERQGAEGKAVWDKAAELQHLIPGDLVLVGGDGHWQDQALHSWHTGWSSPQCHQQLFLHVLLGTATKYLKQSLLLPGKGSCCLLKGLLSNGHDPLLSLTTPA